MLSANSDYVGVAILLFFRFSGGLLRSRSVVGFRFLCLNQRPNCRLLLLKIGKKHPQAPVSWDPGIYASSTLGQIKWQLNCLALEIFQKAPLDLGLKISSSVFHAETVVSRRPLLKQSRQGQDWSPLRNIYWAPGSGPVCVCQRRDISCARREVMI